VEGEGETFLRQPAMDHHTNAESIPLIRLNFSDRCVLQPEAVNGKSHLCQNNRHSKVWLLIVFVPVRQRPKGGDKRGEFLKVLVECWDRVAFFNYFH